MYLFLIVILGILAYLYLRGRQRTQTQVVTDVGPVPIPASTTPASTPEAPASQVVSEFSNATTSEFELLNFMDPRLRTDLGKIIRGRNKIVVWDSQRVNTMRRVNNVKNVLQRLEFRDDDNDNTIEVYRAVNQTGIDTYVFPLQEDDENVIVLARQHVSDDPSETRSVQRTPVEKMNVFLSDDSMVPPDLVPVIRELEGSYKARQSSSGPKAVDTHRS